jgi:hypothetical protein
MLDGIFYDVWWDDSPEEAPCFYTLRISKSGFIESNRQKRISGYTACQFVYRARCEQKT